VFKRGRNGRGTAADGDVTDIWRAIGLLKNPMFERARNKKVERLTAIQDLRSGVIRFLACHAGQAFKQEQEAILGGAIRPLLRKDESSASSVLLEALKQFAASSLYSSPIVRQRELTAHAALCGLLTAYLPLMACERDRWQCSLAGKLKDHKDRPIARDSSLVGRIAKKYLAVYREAVRLSDAHHSTDSGSSAVMERIHRLRLVVDYISGMTDEFALESFQLISGVHINPHRN
jgi:dGTPase